jgi:single-stranded-DNA-specific exonuclease
MMASIPAMPESDALPAAAAERARAIFGEVARRDAGIVVAYHGDADGISAAAILAAAGERLGGEVLGRSPAKGENVHAASFAEVVARAYPELVVVLDTGARAGRLFGDTRTIVVDHHRAPAPPDVDAFVSTRGDGPETATSALALALAAPLAPLADRAWLAAVGLLGDLGDRARAHPVVAAAAKAYGITNLREVVALVNAAGRSARHEVHMALAALRAAASPREILGATSIPAARLFELREEVSASIMRARHEPPSVYGRWAIVEIAEPCRVHGVIAQSWTRRLASKIVLVANKGYVAGKVHFSVRSHQPLDLRAELRALLPDAGDDFAAGHDRATGGIVDPKTYASLRDAIWAAGRA